MAAGRRHDSRRDGRRYIALKTEHMRCVLRHISWLGDMLQPDRSPQISSRSEVLDAGGFLCLVDGGGFYLFSIFPICSP